MSPALTPVEQLPGFRRRIRITPRAGVVDCEFEDDYHRMSVSLRHDGQKVTGVDAALQRSPWTTCPGAAQQLRQTFTGVPLAAFIERGEKRENCTHLYDMAVLCAAHALDAAPLVYDILVSDPVDGRRQAEIRGNGARLLGWIDEPAGAHGYSRIIEPAELAGRQLDQLRSWILRLAPRQQEAARMLQWCAIMANGRKLTVAQHVDVNKQALAAGRCYTFDERRIGFAKRIGDIQDFSPGKAQVLSRLT